MTHTAKEKFVQYIGGAHLSGKNVALYQVGDEYKLRAEDVRTGRTIRRNPSPDGDHYTCARTVTREELDRLFADWESGVYSPATDVTVTERALRALGAIDA